MRASKMAVAEVEPPADAGAAAPPPPPAVRPVVAVPIAIVSLRPRDSVTQTVVLILSAGIFVDALRAVVQGTLQGLHKMTTLAAFPAVAGAVYAAAAAVALTRGAGVVFVAGAYVA